MSKFKRKILVAFMALALVSTVPVSVSAAETSTTATSQPETASTAEPVEPDTPESASSTESFENSESSDLNYLFSENTQGNANLIASQEVIADNGKFQFIAVTTRQKDVFYVIIDKMKSEDNVYFLNEVDTYDLQSLMNKNNDSDDSDSNSDTAVSSDSDNSEVSDTADSDGETSSDNGMSNILILGGVVVLAIIGFIIFKIKKGGFGKKNQSAIPLDDDFEEDDVEINEDEEKKE